MFLSADFCSVDIDSILSAIVCGAHACLTSLCHVSFHCATKRIVKSFTETICCFLKFISCFSENAFWSPSDDKLSWSRAWLYSSCDVMFLGTNLGLQQKAAYRPMLYIGIRWILLRRTSVIYETSFCDECIVLVDSCFHIIRSNGTMLQ